MPTRTFRYSQQDFSGGVGEHPERLADNELAAATYLDCVSERPALQLGGLVNNHALFRQLGGIQGLWFSGYYNSNGFRGSFPPDTITSDAERGTSPSGYTSLIAISSMPDGTRVREMMVNLPAPYAVSGLTEGQMYFPTRRGQSSVLTDALDGSDNTSSGVAANLWVGGQVAVSKNRGMLLFTRDTTAYNAFGHYRSIYFARNLRFDADANFPTLIQSTYIRTGNTARWSRPNLTVHAQSPDLFQRVLPLLRGNFAPSLTGNEQPNRFEIRETDNVSLARAGDIVAYDTIGDYLFFARRYGGSVFGIAPYRLFPSPTGNTRPFITEINSRTYDSSKLLRLDMPDGEEITHMYALGTYLHIYTRQGPGSNYQNTVSKRYRWNTLNIISNPNNPEDSTTTWEDVSVITGQIHLALLWRGIDWIILEAANGLQIGYITGREFVPVRTLPYTPVEDAGLFHPQVKGVIYNDQLVFYALWRHRWYDQNRKHALIGTLSRKPDGTYAVQTVDDMTDGTAPAQLITKNEDNFTAIAAANEEGEVVLNFLYDQAPQIAPSMPSADKPTTERTNDIVKQGVAVSRLYRMQDGGRYLTPVRAAATVEVKSGESSQKVEIGLRSTYTSDFSWQVVHDGTATGGASADGQVRFEVPGDAFSLADQNSLQMAVRIQGYGVDKAPSPIIRGMEMEWAVHE